MKRGMFIVLEGIDGAGKTIQSKLLERFLILRDYDVWLTHEPVENNFWGKVIRFVLKKHIHLPQMFFQRMYYWNRLLHVKEIIRHLNQGQIVICDRYWYSTVAYGYSAFAKKAKRIIAWQANLIQPDIIFYFDLPVEIALQRIQSGRQGNDFFEKEKKLIKIKQGYEFCWSNFSEAEKNSLLRIEGNLPIEEVRIIVQLLFKENEN